MIQTITAVIADDESLARVWLRKALELLGVTVLGEGETGIDAVRLCEELRPDALFTDIRMPDLSGMEVAVALGQLPNPPRLVFVTGYAEHAAEAFEKAAFDYLLKPVGAERLAVTLGRLQRAIGETGSASSPPPPTLALSQRLPVRTDYALRLVRIAEIECAVAHQKRVFIRVGEEELKTSYTLLQLEQILPPVQFMRIHASVIVQLDRVEQINFLGNHTYNARLTSGLIVPIGRNQYHELQQRLGI
jgi:two-component system, LytTR family, response regulator